MRCILVFLCLSIQICQAQQWFGELMVGTASYNGDLTQSAISLKRLRPAIQFNLKYNSGDVLNIRAGIGFGQLYGADRLNRDTGLKSRNLDFKTNIIELNVCGEYNLLDPEIYTAYPYVFGGVGVFHFNPYTYDKNNNKTFLRPLSTEGQGLPEYPNRKKYSLYQFCLPVGTGFKVNIRQKWELWYEFGYRFTFTDYIDDVSKSYVSLQTLEQQRGATAAELAYRKSIPFMEDGEARGNKKVRDMYFFSGLKVAVKLGKPKK